MAKVLSLSKPWRIDDVEHRNPFGRPIYYILDCRNMVVAIFMDEHLARAVIEWVNGSDHVQAELRGGD